MQQKGNAELGGYWDKAIGQNKHIGVGRRGSKIEVVLFNVSSPQLYLSTGNLTCLFTITGP